VHIRATERPNRFASSWGSRAAASAVVACLCVPGVAVAAGPQWQLEQLPPPAGALYKVPVGAPGDLRFIAPNRGLLATSGNAIVPAGLLYWNGANWSQLATVCGGTSETTRIAVAGPNEFWTVSSPSRPRVGDGISLCHFKNGEVIGSYGKQPQDSDPYWRMNAAACSSANDCWFGGIAAADPTGGRQGAFRIHWDGKALTTVYGPQGRAIADMVAVKGTACPVTVTDQWTGPSGWGVLVASVPKGLGAAAGISSASKDATDAGAASVVVVDADRHHAKPVKSWLVVAKYANRKLALAARPRFTALHPEALVVQIAAIDPKVAVQGPDYLSRVYESVLAGSAPGSQGTAVNRYPEPRQVLLNFTDPMQGSFAADPFQPDNLGAVPDETLDMLAMDTDGTNTWATGSGAASGPLAPAGGMYSRKPIITFSKTGPDCTFAGFKQVPTADSFKSDERLVDIASVPGTDTAWVAVQPYADRASRNAYAQVARVDGATGEIVRMQVPADGVGHGAAAKVACTAANDCWLVTTVGWIYHWTDGVAPTVDTESAYQTAITFRPNESAAQFIPDTPPADDSNLFAPPVLKPVPKPRVKTKRVKLKPLMTAVKSNVRGMTLTISFTLQRKARVGLIAKNGRTVVARTPNAMLRPGRHSLSLALRRDRWPTGLAFSAVEPGLVKKPKPKGGSTGGLIGN